MTPWAVLTVAILIAGGLGALVLGSEQLAIFLAGAAAGYVGRQANGAHRRRTDPHGVTYDDGERRTDPDGRR